MIVALILSAVLFLGAIASHLMFLERGRKWLSKYDNMAGNMAVSLLVLISHLLVAALFAVGFWFGHQLDLGGFDKVPAMDWMDYFYFSLVNMTTLGLGDIYPTQHLRVVAGIGALAGFALISCSAQLFWSMMKKGDKQ